MRIQRACKLLKTDALLIENPSDLFYLTGQWFSAGRLVLKREGATLLVDGRYFGKAKESVSCEVVLAEKEALSEVLKGVKKVGFDSSFVTVDRLNALPKKEWVPVSRPLKNLRVSKDEGEIAALKRAAHATAFGFRRASSRLREGVAEQELALHFEVTSREYGASKCSFEPIVAFGENSAYPHYRAGKALLKKNQIALFDLGAVVDDYRGDMTRICFFGQPNEQLSKFDGLVKKAHDMAAAKIRPGTRVGDLDALVRAFFEKEGVLRLYAHGLGHGVGIDIHEYPLVRADGEDRDLLLSPGMVFTIEPGLYLPGVGGVRYENTHVVTEDGSENFYTACW